MARINPVDRDYTTGSSRRLLNDVQSNLGMVPNIIQTLAHAPAALEGYVKFSSALNRGVLPESLREQIAVAVAEANHCSYCLTAHSAIGRTVGLSDDAIMDARRGVSTDRKVEAALQFAGKVVNQRGVVDDLGVAQLRDAGYNDQEIVEITANIAISIFANYFSHVAGTEADFPEVSQLAIA